MKRRYDYKQKHQADVSFEQDSTGHNTPIPTVPSPFEEICAAEETTANNAALPTNLTHEQIEGQAKQWLSNEGLSKPQQELVLGVFDNRPTLELIGATGRSKSWIYAECKKPKIKRAIEALKNGKAGQTLPSESQATPSPVSEALGAVSFKFTDWNTVARLRGWTSGFPILVNASGSKAIPLCEVKRCASELFKEVRGMDKTGPSDYWPTSSQVPTPTPEIAKQIVRHIRSNPGALLDWGGRYFLETLVQLLEAASWGVDRAGWCGVDYKKKRKKIDEDELPYMPYVASGWNRKRVAKAARKILEGMWARGPGDSLVFPHEVLTTLLDGILERVAELQAEWQSFSVGRKESGLTPFHQKHAEELRDFTESELRSILDGDLLGVACGLAERELGVSAETFRRYHVEALVRLRERPYAEGRLAFVRLLDQRNDRKA